MPRNRGKSKPKLRDFSRVPLTRDELSALGDALHKSAHPIVTAILGALLLEHELENLLRKRFRRKDDETWAVLMSDNGPLSSFYTKIVMGYAFGIYNDRMHDDLHIIRNVRNAFAHSKKLIDFDNELVAAEIKKAKNLPKRYHGIPPAGMTFARMMRSAYVVVCFRLARQFATIELRSLRAKNRRFSQRKTPFTNALLPFLSDPKEAGFGTVGSLGHQIADPKTAAGIGILSGFLDRLPKPGGNGDK